MRLQSFSLVIILMVAILWGRNSLHLASENNAARIVQKEENVGRSFFGELSEKLLQKAGEAQIGAAKLKEYSMRQTARAREGMIVLGANVENNVSNLTGSILGVVMETKNRITDIHRDFIDGLADLRGGRGEGNSSYEYIPSRKPSLEQAAAEIPAKGFDGCEFPVSDENLTGRAQFLKYLDENLVILERNPQKRWPMASLTKLMTAIVVLENFDLDAKITLSEKAANIGGIIGHFNKGEIFSARDLISAMLIASSNTAAQALAESMREVEFVNKMQEKAHKLLMEDTSYVDPTGLSFLNQTTVYDLAKLADYIRKNHPEILDISRRRKIELTELKTGEKRPILNINIISADPDFMGGKTGYIEESGRNLLAIFNLKGKMLLSIVLGAKDSFAETRALKEAAMGCLTGK